MLPTHKFALGLLLICSSAAPAIAHADQEAHPQASAGMIESIEAGNRTIQIDGKKYEIDSRNPSCQTASNSSVSDSVENLQRGQAVLFRIVNSGKGDNVIPHICIAGSVH